MRPSIRAAPCALLLSAACTGEELQPLVPEWALSAEPTLVIGSDATPETIFGSIRDVAVAHSGQIAIVDGQAEEVRLFGDDGEYLRTVARRGGGPGEFEAILWVQAQADTLLVKDLMRGTVTLLGVDGSVHRRVTIGVDSAAVAISLVRRLPGGRWLAVSQPPWPLPATDSMKQDSVIFGLLGPDAEGPFQLLAATLGEPLILLPATRSFGFARFHVTGTALPLGSGVAVVHADTGLVQLFNATGAETGRFSIPVARQPLTSVAVEAAIARDVSQSRSERGRAEVPRFYAAEPRPAMLPAVRSVLADGDDLLWFEEFQLDLTAPHRFSIVQTDGSLLARLTVPRGVRLHQVGPDWVLGTTEDENGVPQVVRYGLVRR